MSEETPKRPDTRLDANDIKREIKSFLGNSNTIFEALGIRGTAVSTLILDGANLNSLPDRWLPSGERCMDCLSAKGECYNPLVGYRRNLVQFIVEGLMVLKCLVKESEFSQILANSVEIGPYTVLLTLARNKDAYLRRLEEKKKPFLDFMSKFRFMPSRLVFVKSIAEMHYLYDAMWKDIKENKYDVLAYISSFDSTVRNEAMWKPNITEGELMDAIREGADTRYATIFIIGSLVQ